MHISKGYWTVGSSRESKGSGVKRGIKGNREYKAPLAPLVLREYKVRLAPKVIEGIAA